MKNCPKVKSSKPRSNEFRQMAIYVIPALKICLRMGRGGTEGGVKEKELRILKKKGRSRRKGEDDGEDPFYLTPHPGCGCSKLMSKMSKKKVQA